MTDKLPIAVFISGGGTTLRNLLGRIAEGKLEIDIRLVISSSPSAKGLDYASAAGITTLVVEKIPGTKAEVYSEQMFAPCREAGVKLVAMAGFLKHVLIPADFENRVLNIHPSLIPSFCGKGMYGPKVHQAAIAFGAKISGCTVHFVDNQYDHGPILLQQAVPVLPSDTADDLAHRVFEAECEIYPEAISLVAAGRVSVVGRKVVVA